jgi:hypothetical protein
MPLLMFRVWDITECGGRRKAETKSAGLASIFGDGPLPFLALKSIAKHRQEFLDIY